MFTPYFHSELVFIDRNLAKVWDFILGYMKLLVFVNKSETTDALVDKIYFFFADVLLQMLKSYWKLYLEYVINGDDIKIIISEWYIFNEMNYITKTNPFSYHIKYVCCYLAFKKSHKTKWHTSITTKNNKLFPKKTKHDKN